MKLLIMRHGIAEDRVQTDFSRQLTKQGIAGVELSALALLDKKLPVVQIIASPLVRAQQTAKLMSDKLGLSAEIMTTSLLSPSGDPERVINEIEGRVKNELCLLVSHQPFVSIFIRYLSGIDRFMDTANIACIRAETLAFNCGDLEWFIAD